MSLEIHFQAHFICNPLMNMCDFHSLHETIKSMQVALMDKMIFIHKILLILTVSIYDFIITTVNDNHFQL